MRLSKSSLIAQDLGGKVPMENSKATEQQLEQIDYALAGDALIKLVSVNDILNMLSNLGGDHEDLVNALLILLEDIYQQFISAGVDPVQTSRGLDELKPGKSPEIKMDAESEVVYLTKVGIEEGLRILKGESTSDPIHDDILLAMIEMSLEQNGASQGTIEYVRARRKEIKEVAELSRRQSSKLKTKHLVAYLMMERRNIL
jgi:hypothetical protein